MFRTSLAVLLLAAATARAGAQEAAKPPVPPDDLGSASLEDLLNTEVTSVSKREERLANAAAAIYVITQEDIRRSGATTIAEALRMAPGLNVARINGHDWAISSRGFNSFFANKLLVLVDGRSVYTPLFSGVFWDVQDTLLEDIYRIEVIRGPGAALWGANAVNGVINIITHNAKATQGLLATGATGTDERFLGGVRYGDTVGKTAYRAFAKYFDRDDLFAPGGGSGGDGYRVARGGFRSDTDLRVDETLTVSGEFYDGSATTRLGVPVLAAPFTRLVQDDFPLSGGHLLARWNRRSSATSQSSLRAYFDRTERASPVHREKRNTVDVEFQQQQVPARRHDLVWGLGYRFTQDDLQNSPTIRWTDRSRGDHLFSAFAQDDVTLQPDRLRLTLGTRLEHNDYTGFEIQPNVRFLWTPTETQSVWGAVSRAVRTPSRFEHTVRAVYRAFPLPVPPGVGEAVVVGTPDYRSEELIAYELGYRTQLTPRLSLDLASFYNDYDDLRTLEPGKPFFEPGPPPHAVTPLFVRNRLSGRTYGAELAANWSVTDRWRLSFSYSALQVGLRPDANSRDSIARAPEGDTPEHQLHLRSYLDLSPRLSFDVLLYHVSRLESGDIPAYTRADARFAWRPSRDMEVSLTFQNLFDRRHQEFGPTFLVTPSEIGRSVYGKLTWRR